VQAELHVLARRLRGWRGEEDRLAIADALDALVPELERRPPVRGFKAPGVSRRVTPELEDEVRAWVKAHPEKTLRDAGNHFNLTQWRVSVIIGGPRE
jgi:hypothetical protein